MICLFVCKYNVGHNWKPIQVAFAQAATAAQLDRRNYANHRCRCRRRRRRRQKYRCVGRPTQVGSGLGALDTSYSGNHALLKFVNIIIFILACFITMIPTDEKVTSQCLPVHPLQL